MRAYYSAYFLMVYILIYRAYPLSFNLLRTEDGRCPPPVILSR